MLDVEVVAQSWKSTIESRISHLCLHFFQSPENPVIRLPRMVEDWQSAQVMGVGAGGGMNLRKVVMERR